MSDEQSGSVSRWIDALKEGQPAAVDALWRRYYERVMAIARDANIAQVHRHLEETRPEPGKTDLRGFEWYYLDRLSHSEGRTLNGHTRAIWSLDYSPDGRKLASGGEDCAIKIWDAATGQPIRTLSASKQVYTVIFQPGGARLASGGADQAVTLWDGATGQSIRTLTGH